jgi:hypothetical protein
MKTQKHKNPSIVSAFLRGVRTAATLSKLGRKQRRIVGGVLVTGFVVVTYVVLIAVRASYARTNQSVITPFVIHVSGVASTVDAASLKIVPTTAGTWSVHKNGLLSGKTLEFTPATNFKPGTYYKVAPFVVRGLFGIKTRMRAVTFTTVSAPTVAKTGLVALADNSIIAPDATFTVKLTKPSDGDVHRLELKAGPGVTTSLTTSDNDTTYTWHPKKLLPSGKTLNIAVYDPSIRQNIVEKQITVADSPQVASFNEPTGFSQGDTARITFNKPLDTATARIHFDTDGSGTWESPTVYAFTPTAVQPAQTYHYTIDAGVRSTDGGLTDQPLTGAFGTFGHVSVGAVGPTGSGLNQASQVVSFAFDHAVDHQSAVDHFSISSGTVTNQSWNGNTLSVTVASLGYGQKITATMASGVVNAGFGLPSDKAATLTFRTAAQAGVTAQLAYATAHWDEKNNATYGNLDSVGGDCANFVSQTLIARGWKMDGTWYNHGPSNWSAAWGYVPSMDNYMHSISGKIGLQYLNASQRSKYAVGDIVIFSWEGASNADSSQDHVEMISETTNQGGQVTVKLASHNNYGLYRDLDSQITTEHPGATFHVWHLTQDTN